MKLILIFFITLSTVLFAADDSNHETYAKEAIREMSKGNFELAIEKLEKALELSGGEANYAYELAHCHYQLRNYRDAIFILDTLIRRDDAQVHYFQMLGNCYDYLAKKDAAINIYTVGINKFPDSGRLYMELGTAEYGRNKFEDAEMYWKIAIDKEPYYDNTYYRLAKYFHEKKHYVAALYFGELFLNLTFNEDKFKDINQMLFKIYNESLCETCPDIMEMVSKDQSNLMQNSFFYEKLYNLAYKKSFDTKKTSLTLADINELRKNFRLEWKIMQGDATIDDPLVQYTDKIANAGMFDEYNYWLMSEGDTDEFVEWAKKHYVEFTDFINWKTENRIELEDKSEKAKASE